MESTSQLTVQGKGVYKICPRCKESMIRDDSKVYTSMPPQYGYECPKCGEMEFDTVMYDSPEIKEQKFTHHETNESLKAAVTHQMEDDGDVDDFVRKGIDEIALKYAKLGAKWQKEQKPEEWSDEDEETLEKLHRILVICRGEKKFIQEADYNKMYNLLKSLRPSWKPNNEQMKALHAASSLSSLGEYVQRHLWSLYEQLKKLM